MELYSLALSQPVHIFIRWFEKHELQISSQYKDQLLLMRNKQNVLSKIPLELEPSTVQATSFYFPYMAV